MPEQSAGSLRLDNAPNIENATPGREWLEVEIPRAHALTHRLHIVESCIESAHKQYFSWGLELGNFCGFLITLQPVSRLSHWHSILEGRDGPKPVLEAPR